jgi:hypothetical protein
MRAHIPLLDNQVSRRHAYLQVIAGRVFCVDLGSRTGIRWDEVSRPSGWLLGDRALGVGPYAIRLRQHDSLPGRQDDGPAELLHPLEVSVHDPDPPPLVFLEADNLRSGRSWQLKRTITLMGRSPDCQIRLSEQGLSRFHCSLLRTRCGVWVVDLLGIDGIEVNGKRMRWCHLHDGDELRVGRVVFRIRFGSSPGAAKDSDFPPITATLGSDATVHSTQPQAEPWAISVDTTPGTSLSRVAEPGSLVLARPAELLLRTIIEQFDSLLREMHGQVQQTMTEMVEAFTVMRRDEMELVRRECDQIWQLSDQIKVLQDRALQTASRNPAPAPIAALEREPARDPSCPIPGTPGRRLGGDEPADDRPLWIRDAEVHVRLTRRIAALQREQQSRWQRLLRRVVRPGSRLGWDPAPSARTSSQPCP